MGHHHHHHGDGHAHSHDHVSSRTPRGKLSWALAITASFMLVEVIAGWWTGSLALIADAGHMLTDAAALALAIWAIQMTARPADAKRSYGYHRMQVLAAFVNGLSLLAIALWIVIEAVRRLWEPAPILTGPMLAVAIAGFAVNLVAFLILHAGDDHHDDVNLRGALLHVLADLLGSAAAITAALVMMWTQWWPIDPLLSLLTAILIASTGWRLTRQTAHVLLEGVPESVDSESVRAAIQDAVPSVEDVHHVHSWSLKPGMALMTLHVRIAQQADHALALKQVHAVLEAQFDVGHATVQVESDGCLDEGCGPAPR